MKKFFYAMEKDGGFTLVEMLVAIAIMIIIPGIIVANFPQIRLQFAVSRAAHKFAQDLRQAQDMSISSIEYKDSFGVVQPVDGYGIHLDTSVSSTQYSIYADKYPGNQQYDGQDYTIQTVDLSALEPGVYIKQLTNAFGSSVSVNFSPPNPDTAITQLNAGANSVDVVFASQSDPNQTKTVTVNTSGLIEVH